MGPARPPEPPSEGPGHGRPGPASALRGLVFVLVLAAIAALALWLGQHVLDTLRARGVRSGFDFLREPAGFALGESWLSFDPSQSYARALMAGLANTVRAALPAMLFAVLLGTAVGLARLAAHPLLRALGGGWVESLRNLPLLILLLACYFVLTDRLPALDQALALGPLGWLSKSGLSLPWPVWQPELQAWRLDRPVRGDFTIEGGAALTPEYLAIVVALSTYTSAYIAEIVRAGVQSVPRGQRLAAQSLGMNAWQSFRHIVGPQALRVIVPALTNQLLNIAKNASLAVAVGYPELMSVTQTTLNQTGRSFECIAVMMAVYLLLSAGVAGLMNLFNRRVVARGSAASGA